MSKKRILLNFKGILKFFQGIISYFKLFPSFHWILRAQGATLQPSVAFSYTFCIQPSVSNLFRIKSVGTSQAKSARQSTTSSAGSRRSKSAPPTPTARRPMRTSAPLPTEQFARKRKDMEAGRRGLSKKR